MQEKIEKLWFYNGRIFILTDKGNEYSQPLELFPALFYASQPQRDNYVIWDDGHSIRWEDVDEDIHITSFYEKGTVNYDNEVNRMLSLFPFLDIKAFASYLGMHWTKLVRYRFGVWTPTSETLAKIKNGIAAIGKEMGSLSATL